MRSGIRWIVCSLTALVLVGCGGGNTSSNHAEIAGVWTGSITTRATGTLEVEFTREGDNLSGTARLTLAGTIYTGPLTGTISGNQVTAHVDYNNGYGTVDYSGTVSGNTFTGTYTRNGGADTGTVSLTKEAGVQTSSISGSYSGSFTPTGGSQKPLAIVFTQTGNTFTATVTANGDTLPSNGTIIGPNITYGVLQTEQGLTVTYSGQVSADGNTISGNYTVRQGEQSQTGTWTVTKE